MRVYGLLHGVRTMHATTSVAAQVRNGPGTEREGNARCSGCGTVYGLRHGTHHVPASEGRDGGGRAQHDDRAEAAGSR